jgi:hypothetical protein
MSSSWPDATPAPTLAPRDGQPVLPNGYKCGPHPARIGDVLGDENELSRTRVADFELGSVEQKIICRGRGGWRIIEGAEMCREQCTGLNAGRGNILRIGTHKVGAAHTWVVALHKARD